MTATPGSTAGYQYRLNRRICFKPVYFFLAACLFLLEVWIAIYMHDNTVRPYGGDYLVVIMIYCFVKAFVRIPVTPAATGVLLFSFLIELLQYIDMVHRLGLDKNTLARIVIGTSFSWTDILAYVLGILTVLLLEYLLRNALLKKWASIGCMLAAGIFLLYYEFSSERNFPIFPVTQLVFYFLLISSVLFVAFHVTRYFRAQQPREKKNSLYLSVYGIACLLSVFVHAQYRAWLDDQPSLIRVIQDTKTAGRETTIFDFKENGALKLSAIYKFSDAYYWGTYEKHNDTLLLDIHPGFAIGKKALLKNNMVRFVDDTTGNHTLRSTTSPY